MQGDRCDLTGPRDQTTVAAAAAAEIMTESLCCCKEKIPVLHTAEVHYITVKEEQLGGIQKHVM